MIFIEFQIKKVYLAPCTYYSINKIIFSFYDIKKVLANCI